MKILLIILLATSAVNAFGKACEVYGISDSPQKLNCSFKSTQIKLSCLNGNYYIDSTKVSSAYHYEVEEGPAPLVFEASKMKLIVLIHSKNNIEAELDVSGRTDFGRCR